MRFEPIQERLRKEFGIKLKDFEAFVISKERSFDCRNGYQKIRDTWYKNGMNIRVCELIVEFEIFLNK